MQFRVSDQCMQRQSSWDGDCLLQKTNIANTSLAVTQHFI